MHSEESSMKNWIVGANLFTHIPQMVQIIFYSQIMDNMLMVISGTKRVVLYRPDDIQYLYMNGKLIHYVDTPFSKLNVLCK